MLVGALPAQRIGWRHSVRDRRAVRRSKIRRLAYRLGLAENQCTGNLPVASDFLVSLVDGDGYVNQFSPSTAARDTLEPVTKGTLPAGQFNFSQLPFVIAVAYKNYKKPRFV